MGLLIMSIGILSFTLLEFLFTPLSSPNPSISNEEFTMIINAFICIIATFIVMSINS